MKILHIAPNAPYNRGWGYQENLLPKYQKKLGHDVTVIVRTKLHREAEVADLLEVDGMTIPAAESVYLFFHQEELQNQ